MPELPDDIVKRAARARYNLDRPKGTDWWATAPMAERAVELATQWAALDAALEGCEVHEEWGWRRRRGDGNWTALFGADTREDAERAAANPCPAWVGSKAQVVHRLVITTPAEPVETEATDAD